MHSNAAVGHGFHPSDKGAFSPSRAKYIKSVSSLLLLLLLLVVVVVVVVVGYD